MSPAEPAPRAEPLHQYVMRWYASFWDEHDQRVGRLSASTGKIAIPPGATYMTLDAALERSSG